MNLRVRAAGRSALAALVLLGLWSAAWPAPPAWSQGRAPASAQDPARDARSAYESARRLHGPNHRLTVVRGFDLATKLAALGRYAEAKPIYRALETGLPRAFAPDGPEMGRLLADMATVWERSGELAPALAFAERASFVYRDGGRSDDPQAIAVLLQRARLELEFGRSGAATALLEEANGRLAGLREPPAHLTLAAREVAFSLALATGRTADARALLPDLEAAAVAAGRDQPEVQRALAEVRVLLREGPLLDAGQRLEGLAARLDRGASAEGLLHANVRYYQGYVYLMRGQYVEAEGVLRRALSIYEARLGGHHPVVARSLHNLALVYQELGGYDQAEAFYARALSILERSFGSTSVAVANTRLESVRLHLARQEYLEGEAVARSALRVLEDASSDRWLLSIGRVALAMALQRQGRISEAAEEYERGIAHVRAVRGDKAAELSTPLIELAELHLQSGRADAALATIEEALAIIRRDRLATPRLGGAGSVARARILARLGRLEEALADAREASALLQQRAELSRTESRLGESEQRMARRLYAEHASLAHRLMLDQPGQGASLAGESFAAAQAAALSSAARAVAQMATRFSQAAGDLGDAVRRREDLVRDWRGLDRLMTELLATPPADRPPGREEEIASGIATLNREIAALDHDISARFPSFRELAFPQPVDVRAVQAVLGEDEALVLQLTLENATFLWLVDRRAAEVVRTDLGRDELEALVRRVRATVDFGARGGLPDFDVAGAAAIYRRTLGALRTDLSRYRHLLFVLDGPLQSLPPALLLPQEPPRERARSYGTLPWLGVTHAISVLPTAGSLVLLRQVDRPSQAPEPFVGFGNPLFGGRPGQQRSLAAINLLRTGAPVDRSVFQRIPPLPETAQELETMRRLLGGSPEAMYFSEKATVAAVKRAPLDRFRVVAFATHAVTAGEFPGTAEPAILLAPGPPTDPDNDGLLRASDISRLKLDAEWVLLSACNTAASDGTPGADGLSGLAQAFIFAGARTLLVSHWAVSSEATVPLTTGTIERLMANPGMTKADALREAMAEMASGRVRPAFSHPAAWAPFILVGDGWSTRN